MKKTTEDHYKISPTAKLTAWWRSRSDIPYAMEIADAIGAEQTAGQLAGDLTSPMASLSMPVMEARYKSIDYAIGESGIDNVLEIACGLSPRGLAIAANNGIYVGTDLPEISAETFPVIRKIASKEGIGEERLHLQPVNVLDEKQLKAAGSYFGKQPFVLCNEGLLMYLNRSEKAETAQNIRKLLLDTGGIWVTPDLAFHEILFRTIDPGAAGGALKENAEARLKKITDTTGRNFRDNYFPGESEAVQFYRDCGFLIREYPMVDKSREPSTLSIVAPELKELVLGALSALKVWVLKPVKQDGRDE